MSVFFNLTSEQLRQAADIKEKISQLEQEVAVILRGGILLEGGKAQGSTVLGQPKKRKISAAGIARIKAAQKVRWAKFKQQTAPAALADSVPDTKLTVNPPAKAKSASSAHARLDRGPAAQPA